MAELKPRYPIRRFDVFAEFNRVQYQSRGMPEDRAKGRAIWAAKVVAGRGGRGGPAPKSDQDHRDGKDGKTDRKERDEDEGFRSVGGVEQTDETFDKEIVNRMGQDFYHEVFQPAIQQAFEQGKQYQDIRDTIRKTWK